MTSPARLLPAEVQRVLVAGSSGAGKSTMARALAQLLGLPYTEIDALQHGPGWSARPEFEADVEQMLAAGRWVTEYQYPVVKPRLLAAAEVVVWLDHPFPVVAWRLVRRSVSRAVAKRPFYNGNVEQFSGWARGSHPLRVVFSRQFGVHRRRTGEELAAAADRGVVVVRLRGREASRWLAGVQRDGVGQP